MKKVTKRQDLSSRNNLIKTLSLIIIFLLTFSNVSKSTHLMGGEITYTCIKNGSKAGFYVFNVVVYRDCMGIPIDTAVSINVHNHPTLSNIALNYIGSNDISPSCNTINGSNPQFSCDSTNTGYGGNGIGSVEEHIYRSDTIRILGTPDQNGWHFTWSSCCRNGAIINIMNPSNYGFTLRTAMYPFTDSTGTVFPNNNNCFDSSPIFYEKPRTILETYNGYDSSAIFNGFTYSHNAYDEELDSISYVFAPPLDESSYNFLNPNSTSIPFTSNYSVNFPINGISMNVNTGRTIYPADQQGNYVTCTKVSAYRCGQLVSEVFREIQVVLIAPTCNLGDTTNGNIGANNQCNIRPSVTPPFFYPTFTPPNQWDTLVHCGDTVSFDIIATDNDVYPNGSMQDLLFEISGGQFYDYNNNQPCNNPPCATFQEIGTGVVPPFITSGGTGSGSFQWITSCNHLSNSCGSVLRPTLYTFVIKVSDDFCPAPAIENSSEIISITVFPPCSNLKAPVSTTSATCAFNDGTASVAPFGGTPPYVSFWFDMNGIPVNPNALSSGDYIIRVTDSTQCQVIDTFTVNGPPTFQVSNTINNVSCFGGSNGSINLITNLNVSCLWNTGDTTLSIDSLSIGNYSVTIIDSFGCTSNYSYSVSEPNQITLDSNIVTNVSCYGGQDGVIDISVSGGITPYNFNWDNGAITEDIDSLSIGVYICTLTDSNGCLSSYSFVVVSPTPLQSGLTSSSVSCNGSSDGSVVSTQSGGTPPYNYLWNTGDSLLIINNIPGGTYHLTISDNNNCVYNDSIFVYEPDSLQSSVITTLTSISGISIGGTIPYTYEFWGPNGSVASSLNNVGTTFTINPITSGFYLFIVTDANNCSDSVSINFNSNFSPTVNVTLSNTWCDSLADLTITVSQDSGEVDMSTALFQSNSGYFNISSMSIGDTIGTSTMMAAGGSINISTYLIVGSIISSNQAIIQPCSPVNGCLGSFTITNSPSGGIELLAQSVPDANNYTQGNMSSVTFNNVFVNPCIPLVFTSTINSELGDIDIQTINFNITFITEQNISEFNIFPNPNTGIFDIKFVSEKIEDYEISIVNILGEDVFEEQLKDFSGTYLNRINISEYCKSVYFVKIRTRTGNITKKLILQ
jgi:hypothetical protein